ncbi:MAG: type II toxin-antitoxin system VapC family toxin, partial [Chthoniobacterales bacterium]
MYAYNEGALQHHDARSWLEECLSGSEPVAFTWPTVTGFLRVSTNRRVPKEPASIQQAVGVVDDWL